MEAEIPRPDPGGGRGVLELNRQFYKLDIVDPTGDGVLTRIVNFGISALMVLVVFLGAWYAFKEWMGTPDGGGSAGGPGKPASAKWSGLRNIVFGVIIIEAILGGILVLANYGTSLLPSVGVV